MGFFKIYDKINSAVDRGYARWGKWIWGSLLVTVLAYGGWLVWAAIWGPPSGPVILVIHSEIDRPILGFSVNGVAGSNAFAHGGGGATCCGNIGGKTAEVIWTLSTTRPQFNAGMRKETRRVIMPLPERKWQENYLHVYFLPEDKIFLWWGEGFIHPKTSELSTMAQGKETQE
ncbi:hypothetical protein RJ498_000609 [Pluralibacter gergoviae]